MYSGNLNPCIDTISQGTKKEVYLPLYYYLYCRGEVNPLYELFTISYDNTVCTCTTLEISNEAARVVPTTTVSEIVPLLSPISAG